ncbi:MULTISPECIES: ABC transporter substrate-binding protein [unclassified Streptomyces]|uniref:ABC transporter substrate-binding protein n=1 Tax=unclassified Streptomyces TaxID=2593676 RepID=UPI00225AF2A9|nr:MULTISPECIES: ABC transporter substrate-binding protein [unclassified Streptomyces]MCX4528936.1 ABC transporter substrate-binding protein [Streptomyces sp. NBC_01551]MCX4540393.1 ABC transporter substrate-binding protein [Streptomyces sp. NBC_01565]
MLRPIRAPRPIRALAAAAAALALVSACNSASNSSQPGRPGDAAGTTRGVSADSIKVGGIVSMTSAGGYSKKDTDLGARARYLRANAEGGINGRKIDYIGAEDDGQDPGKNLAAARKLVQQDKVFAVAPMSSVTFSGADFLEQEKVPTFGWGTLPSFCGPKHIYGFNGCLVPSPGGTVNQTWPEGIGQLLGGAKGKSVAIIANDSDAGKFGIRTFQQGFAAAGFEVAYAKASVPGTAVPSDWSAYVKDILAAGGGKAPDAVVSVMQTPNNIGLFTALKRAGYKGLLSDPTDYDPALLAKDTTKQALDGVHVLLQFEPFESTSPGMAQFKADIKAASGGQEIPLNMHMLTGYMSADLFVSIAQKAGKDLTVTHFQNAAQSFSDTGTLVGDRAEPKGQKDSFGCGALVQLKNGAYEVSVPFTCREPIPFK